MTMNGKPSAPNPRTGFLLHPAAALHDAGWGHPEHQGRMRYLASAVSKDMLALWGSAKSDVFAVGAGGPAMAAWGTWPRNRVCSAN